MSSSATTLTSGPRERFGDLRDAAENDPPDLGPTPFLGPTINRSTDNSLGRMGTARHGKGASNRRARNPQRTFPDRKSAPARAGDSTAAMWISSVSSSPSTSYLRVKSVLDFIGAALLLIAAAPIMAAVALAIKLTSPGAVLFSKCASAGTARSVLYKFRSMLENVEEKISPTWSRDGDVRATPVRRFIRRFHLDELPQALNVLRGERSLVGPRPGTSLFCPFPPAAHSKLRPCATA